MLRSRIGTFLLIVVLLGGVAATSGVFGLAVPAAGNAFAAQPVRKVSFVPPRASAVPLAANINQAGPQATALPFELPVMAPGQAPGQAPTAVITATAAYSQTGVDPEGAVLAAVYRKANPSVVEIVNLAQSVGRRGINLGIQPQGEGSGFLWDRQGHIVTNDHVIDGADRLKVVLADGAEADATLVGTDPGSDIAVVQVDASLVSSLTPLERADVSQVQVGDMAIAIGNPFGFQNTMTRGIISALGRSIPSQTQYSIPEAIQTDAAINPGNSGGPLLNAHGQVLGVNDQIDSQTGSSSGVGFAIPIDLVQRVVPALIQNGKYEHAYLGITADTYSRDWAQALGLPASGRGIYVMDAQAGGPAANAGLRGGTQDTGVVLTAGRRSVLYLQNGGDLITAIDGQRVLKMDDLLLYLEQHASPGQKVELTVLRNGKLLKATVILGVRPDQTTLQSQGNGEPQA